MDSAIVVAVVIVIVITVVVVIAAMATIVVITMVMVVIMVTTIVVTVVTVLVIMFVHAIVLARTLDLPGARLVLFAAALEFRPPAVIGLVFPGTNEVHRSVTRVVLMAVSAPIVRMFGWNMQVQRLDHDFRRGRLDDHRLRIEHWWRRATAQVHATVNTRGDLPPDRDTDIEVAGVCQRTKHAVRQGKQRETSQHVIHLVVSSSRHREDRPPCVEESKAAAR
jgi:hypothetical protein